MTPTMSIAAAIAIVAMLAIILRFAVKGSKITPREG